MRGIITGGTGLIGRHLTAELVRSGHKVTILSRHPDQVVELPAGVHRAGWDGSTSEGWIDLVEDADGIINLAGESLAGNSLLSLRWTFERKRRILTSRLNAGKAILEAVTRARYKPAVLMQVSAVGYYGARDANLITEDAPAGKDFLARVCVAWENSTASVTAFGVRQIVVRLGVVLSSQGGALPRQMLPFKLFVGGPLGNGEQAYPWIHIQDAVGAMRYLLENPASNGAYNLTAPQIVTNAEFGQALASAMHRPYWLPVPAFVFKIAFGEASIVLLEGQAPIPQKLKRMGYSFLFPEVLPALQDILKK